MIDKSITLDGGKQKIKSFKEFPKMIWLGDYSLYDKALFIRSEPQFLFMIDELSYELSQMKQYD